MGSIVMQRKIDLLQAEPADPTRIPFWAAPPRLVRGLISILASFSLVCRFTLPLYIPLSARIFEVSSALPLSNV